MRISPSRHELEFGESLTWRPPTLAARFYVWDKTPAFSRSGDYGTDGGAAPRWVQVAGYDIASDVPIVIAEQETTFTLSVAGVTATWEIVAGAFDGFDPELAMITALDADGLVLTIDRYSMPNPESSAGATIAGARAGVLAIAAQCPLRARRDRARARIGPIRNGCRDDGYRSVRSASRRVPSAHRVVRTGSRRQRDSARGILVTAKARSPLLAAVVRAKAPIPPVRAPAKRKIDRQDFEQALSKIVELEERIKVLEEGPRGTAPRLGVVGRVEQA